MPAAATPSTAFAEAGRRGHPWTRLEAGLFAGVLFLGLLLRFDRFTEAPLPTDNADELDWAWSGLTLITRHQPYGWSYLPAYPHPVVLAANGTTYPIVHPYLDHPPLFSVIVGALAWSQGARDLLDVSIGMIRPAAIVLSVVTLALLYLLGRDLVGSWAALIGVTLLATSPGAVLMGRVVESEALLAPLLLGSLICAARIGQGRSGAGWLLGLVACCALAALTKVPGLAVAGTVAVLLVVQRRWGAAVLALFGGGLGLAAYAAYGGWLDWQLFTRVWAGQSGARHGLLGAWQYVTADAGVNRSLHDGWWLLGWLGLVPMVGGTGRREAWFIAWPVVAYTAAILVLANDRVVGQFGWYRLTVYPLVYLAAGKLVWNAVRDPSPVRLAILLVVPGTVLAASLLDPNLGLGPGLWVLLLVFAAILGPALLASATGAAWSPLLRRWTAGTTLGILVALNVAVSLLLPQLQFHL